MKNYLFIIAALLITSCSSNTNPKLDLVEKRVTQSITAKGLGLIKDVNVFDVTELDSINFKATRTFTNTMFNNAEVKITEVYTFDSPSLDKISSTEQFGKTLMKVEGEWIETGF